MEITFLWKSFFINRHQDDILIFDILYHTFQYNFLCNIFYLYLYEIVIFEDYLLNSAVI